MGDLADEALELLSWNHEENLYQFECDYSFDHDMPPAAFSLITRIAELEQQLADARRLTYNEDAVHRESLALELDDRIVAAQSARDAALHVASTMVQRDVKVITTQQVTPYSGVSFNMAPSGIKLEIDVRSMHTGPVFVLVAVPSRDPNPELLERAGFLLIEEYERIRNPSTVPPPPPSIEP